MHCWVFEMTTVSKALNAFLLSSFSEYTQKSSALFTRRENALFMSTVYIDDINTDESVLSTEPCGKCSSNPFPC